MRLAVGTRLGKYEILRFIAEGGMGELYVARASGIEGFQKTVALKRILSRYASRAEHVRMFLDEAKLAATLHHSNIVQVFDMGNEAGSLFFSMEYVHGTDLRTMLEKARESGRPIPWAVAIEIAIEIAAALHHAHEAGIVHRDVSPSNVLLAYDGVVKLTDFGIAKAAEQHGETRPGVLKGKVAYMSPEQCRDQSLDRRSDVFALGILLFELTTLEQPFGAGADFATMEQIVNRDADSPASKRADYPPELAAIVSRALARDREQRFTTAQEMQRELIAVARARGIDNSPLVLEAYLRELFGDEVDAWRRAFVESTRAQAPTEVTTLESTPPPAPTAAAEPGRRAVAPRGTASAQQVRPRSRRWPWVAAAGALAGAVILRAAWPTEAIVPLRCATDLQCATANARGFCDEGFCTFEDGTCESGWRYGDRSGDRANVCLDACVLAVAAGGDHVCSRQRGGAVVCWGANARGQLGIEGQLDGSAPTPTGVTAVELASGGGFTCARIADGTVSCWGVNDIGQLGVGKVESRATPSQVKDLRGATRIAAGSAHACAVASRRVWCWGDNEAGQLGDNTREVSAVPVELALGASVVEVAAGGSHTCALDLAGKVWCWGDGEDGQLGDGKFEGRSNAAVVAGLPPVASIASGFAFTCAAGRDGSAWCWGANDRKQLGAGNDTSGTPVRVSVSDVREIRAGNAFACVRREDRSVWCWGDNRHGELGDPAASGEPVEIGGLLGNRVTRDIVELTTGTTHACARGHTGRVWCWGDARDGRLGTRSELARRAPAAGMVGGATAIVAGNAHTCALVGARIWCWGDNDKGQLGDGGFIARSTPAVVLGIDAVELAASNHTCARLADGSVWCWGDNSGGQLDGSPELPRATPARAPRIPASVQIAVGDGFTCSRDASGGVWCWGDHGAGELGSATTSAAPSKVALPKPARAIGAGGQHACAIIGAGEVWCWGQNDNGELGDATFKGHGPVRVALANPVGELVVGGAHACARDAGNAIYCWGSDDRGELGDSTGDLEGRPVRVGLLPADIAELAAGRSHTCARSQDGSVRCWGANTYGQLGDGSTLDRDAPVTTQIQGATRLAAAGAHTCAIGSAGAVVCWGSNGRGQLGDGTPLLSTVPREVVTSCRL